MSGDRSWAAALRAACERPEAVAGAWRASGGRVVGLLGWCAPRELVAAAGMLPVRLSPDRLLGLPGRPSGGTPEPGFGGAGGADVSGPAWSAPLPAPGHDRGSWAANITSFDPRSAPGPGPGPGPGADAAGAFGRELAPATAALAAALLSGELGWIDFLLIGRDREDYTRLFYLLRELRRSGEAPGLPPVAFYDLLRLPARTSARYNRQRAAELTEVIAQWAGRPVTPADLAGAVETAGAIARSFRGVQELRTRPQPAITGTDALAAAVAARVLPPGQLRPLLDAALAVGVVDRPVPGRGRTGRVRDCTGPDRVGPAGPASAGPRQGVRGGAGMSRPGARDIPEISSYASQVRVFLAGSGTDDLAAYAALEDLGLAIVGEDHEWGDDGSEYPRVTRDPLDGIVDRYHFAHGGVARAGLRDRVQRTADRVRGAGADGVLYLLGPHDEAAGWELPALRECLGAGIPLVPVRLRDLASGAPAPGDLVQDVAPGERAQRDRVPADPRQRGRAERAVWAAAAAGPDRGPELREAGRRLLGELGGSSRAANRVGPGRPAAGQPRPPGDPGTSRWTGEDSRG